GAGNRGGRRLSHYPATAKRYRAQRLFLAAEGPIAGLDARFYGGNRGDVVADRGAARSRRPHHRVVDENYYFARPRVRPRAAPAPAVLEPRSHSLRAGQSADTVWPGSAAVSRAYRGNAREAGCHPLQRSRYAPRRGARKRPVWLPHRLRRP